VVINNLNNTEEIETSIEPKAVIDTRLSPDTLDLTKEIETINRDTIIDKKSEPLKNISNDNQSTEYQPTVNSKIVKQDSNEPKAEPTLINDDYAPPGQLETPQSLPSQTDSSKNIDTFVVNKSLILEEQEIKVKTKKVKKKR
ncbi:MAG: hypothetical protein MI922_17420, partial [Bacteroidales bacterium]|nr:hypothetical protein [Bacteroidales bacterium]